MRIKRKYVVVGIDGKIIPREVIPYSGELNDETVLENSTGKEIQFRTKSKYNEEGFILITDDPCHNWLDEKDIYSQWTKVADTSNIMDYCIRKSLGI